jgi:hypothetical protein
MLGLKVLVGVMTVLLIAGFGVLAGGLIMQAKRVDTGFGTAEVTLPAGAKVMETAIQGDRIVRCPMAASGCTCLMPPAAARSGRSPSSARRSAFNKAIKRAIAR